MLIKLLSKFLVDVVLTLPSKTSDLIVHNCYIFQILGSQLVLLWEVIELIKLSSIVCHLTLLEALLISLSHHVFLL